MNALLDEDFLTNLNANEGRLVNSLEHSAGSVPTTSSSTCDDDDMVRHGDKTYPAWPPKRSSSASASGPSSRSGPDTAKGGNGRGGGSSLEMQTHLRNLNVTIAALGLGLAVANDEDNEHSVRSYGAKVSNCEMVRNGGGDGASLCIKNGPLTCCFLLSFSSRIYFSPFHVPTICSKPNIS